MYSYSNVMLVLQRDVMFVGVHDSYWTHAGSVEEMNRVLREKFIELHSRPLLEELRDTLTTLHPKLEVIDETP